MSQRPQPLTRFIYVIGPEHGLQKVGIAVDPQARLAALQTASSFDLLLHAAIAVPFRQAHEVERASHLMLAGCRVRGEWFKTTAAEAIHAVHTATAPYLGQVTPVPDPKVIWPSVASWRVERDRGLPLFDYSQSKEQTIRSGWWSKLRRSLQP